MRYRWQRWWWEPTTVDFLEGLLCGLMIGAFTVGFFVWARG